jgi:hypothetical protein
MSFGYVNAIRIYNMANEIDFIMDLDPLELTEERLDKLVKYHRQLMGTADDKGKVRKPALPEYTPEPSSLLKMLGMSKKEEPKPSKLRRI